MATRDEDIQNTPNSPKNVNDEHRKGQTMGNKPDPSAKRNVGYGGALERADQKDSLENLHIQGNETTGYGANNPKSTEEFAQGPGFEYEGSDTAMDDDVNGIRSRQQPFGEDDTEPNDSDQSRI
ncbi:MULTISPECIES: hypothetical protein [Pontibacter]|uniref:Uncharacterized protein n=1 Tax=Pontibacter lucknowensis TaxID=1077936 RepID=A0A1N6ZDP8_9BACT|nr:MULTISPECIES: hypothetical protein [Pontibacter]EJF10234.1 hypothetical protein O71_10349 [Pontibacter sp. BAB1700]SIR24914.1 hypothetical protein SAMN05421545_2922 [Pontibacter lucknowensis]